MYSNDEIKALIDLVNDNGLTGIEIEDKEQGRIKIEKQINTGVAPVAVPYSNEPVDNAEAPVAHTADKEKTIDSPMVGVFYAAPSPDAAPYVSVGDSVKAGDTVCIIEAMKLMNEITAEESGVIEKILVNNGDIIEYGQPLFTIK